MNALVAAARAYMDAPFQHMGRSPYGMDCAGLLVLAERDCGRELRDVASYTREPWKDGLRAALVDNYGEPVTGEILPGDKLLMAFEGEPQHIAIVTDYIGGGLGLIHTRNDIKRGQQTGRVVEHRFGGKYPSYVVGVFR